MNESHVILTLKEYKSINQQLESVIDECIEHRRQNEDAFGVKYGISGIPTFYTKKELQSEIVEMFDTLNKTIEKLQKENTQLKKPFWKRK